MLSSSTPTVYFMSETTGRVRTNYNKAYDNVCGFVALQRSKPQTLKITRSETNNTKSIR